MKKITNDCCGCSAPGYPCNPDCHLKSVEHWFCDKCREEIDVDEIYEVDGEDLCADCLKERFKKAVVV